MCKRYVSNLYQKVALGVVYVCTFLFEATCAFEKICFKMFISVQNFKLALVVSLAGLL